MSDSKKEINETPASPDITNNKPKEDQESTKKDKDIKSGDNVFSKEEMNALEHKEDKIKTSLVDRIFKKKKKPLSEKTRKGENKNDFDDSDQFSQKDEIKTLKKELSTATSHLDSISISVEKLEGKLENERAVATGIEERISRLTEEIGELRSMILDRERGFNEIETGFKKIEAMAEEMQPEMIKKNLDRKERDIIQISVQMEKVDAIVSETNRQIKLFREQMDKIKSLDNLLKVSKDIEKNISKIKDTERYTGRMAAKTEELFTELDKRITQFATQSSKIDSLDELTKELMESFDKTEVKLKEAVFKEDLEKLKESIAVSDQKSKDTELTNIKSDLSSLQDNFSKLKNKFELLNIDPLTSKNTKTATPEKTQEKATDELPTLEDIISEKKLSKLRKEIEEQNKKIEELSISISELKNSNTLQNNLTNELKRSYDTLPSTIDSKTNKKTKELKNNIAQMANILSIMQKKEHISKQDINNLKEEIDKKINEIEQTRQKDDTTQQKTKKEIQLLKKTEENTREKLKKEVTEKINKLNKNIKETSSTITNLQDNMKYMEDSINAMKQPPSKQAIDTAINSEINEKTKELKNNMSQMANMLSIMQKKEHISKQDINNLKEEIDEKINKITEMGLKDKTTQQKTKKEMELLKKAEEDAKENLRKEFTEKINLLNENIKETSDTITNLQDNAGHIKDNTNKLIQPISKDSTNLKTKRITYATGLDKETTLKRKPNTIEDIEKTNYKPIKHETTQNIVSETAFLNEDINTQPLYLNATPFYDHDLRLNKLIRLIDKTEVSLKNNDIEDAKKAFNDLVSAYNTVHKKVPQPQIEEIHVLIEQLNNKLKNHENFG